MTKEFISRKTAGSFQKPNSQFAPRPFATPQQKSAKTENSTLQNVQCSPESSDSLSRIAIAQPETFTPQLTVQRAEQVVANDNLGEETEKIQRSSSNNRLAKISIQPPEPPSTPRFPIQAKLTVGAAGDKYEQEADRVARQVVNRIQAPQVNLQSSESNPVQRKISIQAFGGEGGNVSSEWESQLNQARGGGQPLSPSLREPMEREFGADFGGVRVHTGAQADILARSIQAKAFTTGQDVFFRQGAYEPGLRGGQELIAHELTHVVQQEEKGGNQINRWKFRAMGEDLDTKKSEDYETIIHVLENSSSNKEFINDIWNYLINEPNKTREEYQIGEFILSLSKRAADLWKVNKHDEGVWGMATVIINDKIIESTKEYKGGKPGKERAYLYGLNYDFSENKKVSQELKNEIKVSKNDAEAKLLGEAERIIEKAILPQRRIENEMEEERPNIDRIQVVVSTNVGPCDGCKVRFMVFGNSIRDLCTKNRMNPDIEVIIQYKVEKLDKIRWYDGEKQPTQYGYPPEWEISEKKDNGYVKYTEVRLKYSRTPELQGLVNER